ADTVDIVAGLVEGDKHGVFRDCCNDRLRFRLYAPRRVAGGAVGDLVAIEAAETRPAAAGVKELTIVFGEVPLRPLLRPPDATHTTSHQPVPELVPAGSTPCSRHADRPLCTV